MILNYLKRRSTAVGYLLMIPDRTMTSNHWADTWSIFARHDIRSPAAEIIG